ncbi:MAG TPA: AraC family transcriptional regulator, partial [Alphaproteobacteria bacterium]|nr:AraC family transcriptional regulator [Alphaproteobacteria bacterium]
MIAKLTSVPNPSGWPQHFRKSSAPSPPQQSTIRMGLAPPHRHCRAQLLYAISGVMTVYTAVGAWVAPANRGLWVPPETEHAILNSGLVRLRTVYIEPKLAQRMPDECSVVHISPLLRELLITAVDIPLDRPPEERHEYIMKLILEEIRTLPTLPLYLPIPEGSIIAPVCRDII